MEVAQVHRHFSKAKIQAEIDKCDLVCANCHATRTFLRQDNKFGSVPESGQTEQSAKL